MAFDAERVKMLHGQYTRGYNWPQYNNKRIHLLNQSTTFRNIEVWCQTMSA